MTQQTHRKPLPNPRQTTRWHLVLVDAGGSRHSIYLDVGHHVDGSPGEMFVVLAKEGSTLRGMTDAWAQCFSYALQWGVPLERLVRAWRWSRFEPAGEVQGHPDVVRATSIPDMIVQVLAIEYISKEVHIQSAEPLPKNKGLDCSMIDTPVDLTFNAVSVPIVPRSTDHPGRDAEEARAKGYEGCACDKCGSFRMRRDGTCLRCDECGSSSGGCGG